MAVGLLEPAAFDQSDPVSATRQLPYDCDTGCTPADHDDIKLCETRISSSEQRSMSKNLIVSASGNQICGLLLFNAGRR